MRLLLDANLSWRLKVLLENYFDEVIHVDGCELKIPSKDEEIWLYAKGKNL